MGAGVPGTRPLGQNFGEIFGKYNIGAPFPPGFKEPALRRKSQLSQIKQNVGGLG